jgi:uncharacterized protein YcbK (DUF882 family)
MIKQEKGYFTWNKGVDLSFPNTTHFTTNELECHCKFSDCIEQRFSIDMLNKLEQLRKDFGSAVDVTSGYRCIKRQNQLKNEGKQTAVGISTHTLGEAADVKPNNITHNMFDNLYKLCDNIFMAVGDGRKRGFIHVDSRSDKKRRWGYN